MKILILDQFSEPGGAQLCLRDLAPEIARRGWHATFMAPGDGSIRSSLEMHGIRTERLPGLSGYTNGRKTIGDVASYTLDISRAILSTRRLPGEYRPDLVYINGPRVLPVSMLFRCPIVFHAHNRLVKAYARAIAAACVRFRGVEVIAASRFAGQALDGLIAAGSMRVLYSGVPDMGFVARPRPSEAIRIGIIGRIAPEKGHLELMRAAKLLLALGHRIELAIYGTSMFSEGGYEARVRNEAAGISVHFAGWAQNVAAALHEIDLLAVPSSSIEAAGRVIMEAFSAGTPVVAYSSGGIPELIRNGRTGLLTEQPTPASLARGIGRLLADPALASRISAAGRVEWESRFQVARYQREVCDLFESIVISRSAGCAVNTRQPRLSACGRAPAD
jgi:glycosyltransferase involved in cell wall biosynthesis